MAVYVVTGKLGSGKTLVAVGKIQDKIVSGCKVATNLDLRVFNLPRVGRFAKSPRVIRIPDKPSLVDLEYIGRGNESYDENKNGLLVLDECGTWFNSRSWSDKQRQSVVDWFLHARKLGWDIIFLIQDLSIMDKQARLALAEHVVYCRRLDKITIPFIGAIYSLITGDKMPLPKIHVGIVKYGDSPQSMTVERWTYTGRDLYSSYDTKQAFSDSYEQGVYSYLTPYLSHGRYACPRNLSFYMRLTKIYFKRFSRIAVFIIGFLMSVIFNFISQDNSVGNIPALEVKENKKFPLDKFKITSSSRYGVEINMIFSDAKGNEITSKELVQNGYDIEFMDACHVVILKGTQNEKIGC
ncbi:zonular occludens toxin domain-containing protein [Xenorhabdus sp. SF857]|uniref:zonular occludens toxin domain-containing protein n=1 Tax=Xenorhabdus bakwenae TaxID=3026967 RepID=UPI0025580BD1|nr:zonular occludens toxin domain-containing protein [Xenorhabdus sp. SF857]WFQ80610.1 zonular occludens toxin domain-containing protein [Xenorhabdus sp. SF857]WFQ80621.1 zonular occludens toxin domain-containing protein [Xenorhabdus sp. SF857]